MLPDVLTPIPSLAPSNDGNGVNALLWRSSGVRDAIRNPERQRKHCAVLIAAVAGDFKTTRRLSSDVPEERRRVQVLAKFLTDVIAAREAEAKSDGGKQASSGEGAAPSGNAAQAADAIAETLAEAMRSTGALTALATLANRSSLDAQLVLATFASLARLGLVEALCTHPG